MTDTARILILSTAHLPDSLRHTLDVAPGLCCDEITYGYMLWVPEDDDEWRAYAENDEAGPALVEVMEPIFALARERVCAWIKFDRDEPEDATLPVFEEEE